MMELFLRLIILLTVTRIYCEKLELSAFEYRRIDDSLIPLELGKCPYRVVQYPEHPAVHACRFPDRKGQYISRQKKINVTKVVALHNVSHLLQHIGMCDEQSAYYFGLLAKGEDCVAGEIASKLSFGHKTATWMLSEHYRPRVDTLIPSSTIDGVQNEFLNYLNNSYYTEYIGYGTQEVIIVELHYKTSEEAQRAYHNKYLTRRMSQKLETVGIPRKVKVIRLSTADNILHVKTFRSSTAFRDTLRYVNHCEKQISRIMQEIAHGWRKAHLKYGFKAYIIGPRALKISTVSESDKKKLWENVALLQVDAKRTYTTHKRYRKFCRRQRTSYCIDMRKSIKTLKETITKIHTQRRDWLKLTYDQQLNFVTKGRNNVKLLKTRIIILAKELRKMMKKP
ncbi:hypothetical protein ACF0H5_020337 [Mactra antiquata]